MAEHRRATFLKFVDMKTVSQYQNMSGVWLAVAKSQQEIFKDYTLVGGGANW